VSSAALAALTLPAQPQNKHSAKNNKIIFFIPAPDFHENN
jgi:hypothetical protein